METISDLKEQIEDFRGIYWTLEKEIDTAKKELAKTIELNNKLKEQNSELEKETQKMLDTQKDLLEFRQQLSNKEKELKLWEQDLSVIEKRLKPEYIKIYKEWSVDKSKYSRINGTE